MSEMTERIVAAIEARKRNMTWQHTVRIVHPDWTTEQVDAEIQLLESDRSANLSDSPAVCPECGAGPASGSRRAARRLSQ